MSPDKFWHTLLKRQIARYLDENFSTDSSLIAFLNNIDISYKQYESSHSMLERALEISTMELNDSNERMRILLRMLPDVFFRINNNYIILDCHSNSPDNTLKPEKEYFGKSILYIPDKSISEIFRTTINKAFNSKTTIITEYALEINNDLKYYEASFVPIFENQILIFIWNISARKKMEIEITNINKQWLETLFSFSQMNNASIQEIIDFSLDRGMLLTKSAIGFIVFFEELKPNKKIYNWQITENECNIILEEEKPFPEWASEFWEKIQQLQTASLDNNSNIMLQINHNQKVPVKHHLCIPVFDENKIVCCIGVANKSCIYSDNDLKTLVLLMDSMWKMVKNKKIEEKNRKLLNRMQQQMNAISELAVSKALMDGNIPTFCKEITEKIIELKVANRVGIWLFSDDKTELHCYDIYDRYDRKHEKGQTLFRSQLKEELSYLLNAKYFYAIEEESIFTLRKNDTETLQNVDFYSLLHVVISIGERNLGLLCLEMKNTKYKWETDEISFVCHVADQISLSIANNEKINTQKALSASKEKYSNLIDNIGEGVAVLDADYNFMYINKAGENILKIEEGAMIGESIMRFINKEKLDMITTITDRRAENEVAHFELPITRMDGEERILLISSSPKYDNNHQYDGAFGIFRDITERLQNEELKRSIEIAEQSAKLKQQFLANMSHEIRTPISGIIGMTEFLAKTKLSPEQKDYLDTIKQSSEALLNIINDILDLSKIEAGKIDVKKDVVSIEALVSKAKGLFEGLKKQKNIVFDATVDTQLPKYIKTDKKLLTQIISNLISNAVKFTNEGSIGLKITLQQKQEKSSILKFEISDTGIGIKPEDQQKLFSKFMQLDNTYTRSYEGTGLGLSICKELAKILGGEINVISNYGQGSNFWFTITSSDTEKNLEIDTVKDIEKTDDSNINAKILMAEDKLVNQKVISLMLQSAGCTVDIAKNGKEALQLFEKNKYDIILMDIQMPVMDGVTATKELKKRFPKIPPIIALSANALEGDADKYIAEGMDDYIAKPVTSEALYQKILQWLQKSKNK